MAVAKAKQHTTCSFCAKKAADCALFMCIKSECDLFGEIYCGRCGCIAHEAKDHKFDIDSDFVKAVSLKIIGANIKKGGAVVKKTFGALQEQQYGQLRRYYSSGIISALVPGLATGTKTVANVASAINHASTGASGIMATVVDGGLSVASHALGVAGIGAGVMAGFEVVYHSYRFWKGEIATWKEYGYHIAKGLTASVGMGIGNYTGFVVGAAFGALGGPIGAIVCGIIGGIVGGIIGAKCTKSAFEKVWSDDFIHNEQKQRTEIIKKALALFGILDMDDINDKTKFNEQRLKKKFRELAKIYHPDKNGGTPESHAQFAEISAALGVLLALLETKHKPKNVKKFNAVKAITYKNDVKKLKQLLAIERLKFVVNIFEKWNKQYTVQRISTMSEEDILAIMQKMNEDKEFQYNIANFIKKKFVSVIKSWREWSSVDSDDIRRAANRETNEGQPEQSYEDDEKKNSGKIEELRDKLRKSNLLNLVTICEAYDVEYCLKNLMGYSKEDILEVINEINKDESNQYKISVAKKNKFARIIRTFGR